VANAPQPVSCLLWDNPRLPCRSCPKTDHFNTARPCGDYFVPSARTRPVERTVSAQFIMVKSSARCPANAKQRSELGTVQDLVRPSAWTAECAKSESLG